MFSMCSELTPRAPIPDTRIPQLMQPWGQGGEGLAVQSSSSEKKLSVYWDSEQKDNSYMSFKIKSFRIDIIYTSLWDWFPLQNEHEMNVIDLALFIKSCLLQMQQGLLQNKTRTQSEKWSFNLTLLQMCITKETHSHKTHLLMKSDQCLL